MALKRTFMIGVMLVGGMLTGATWGQNHTPGTVFERTPDSAHSLPFASPGVFDYDTQLFAPLEFTNGKEKEPNNGFYFDVARTYTSIERAVRFDSFLGRTTSNGSEYLWGTRYELGWYNKEDRGWNAIYQRTEGLFTANNRAGGFNTTPSNGNIQLTTVEINRTFRQVVSNGTVFEPSIGLRYNWMRDRVDDFSLSSIGTPSQFTQLASNSAVGLQIGGRISKRRARWRFSYRGNAAATYNQQRLVLEDAFPDGTGAIAIAETALTDQTFVPIIDGIAEVAYNVTRDITLKIGAQGIYSWNGIQRANTEPTPVNGLSFASAAGSTVFNPNDENYVAVGFIFGVEWRR